MELWIITYMDLDLETKEYISELTDKIREKYNIQTPIHIDRYTVIGSGADCKSVA